MLSLHCDILPVLKSVPKQGYSPTTNMSLPTKVSLTWAINAEFVIRLFQIGILLIVCVRVGFDVQTQIKQQIS